MLKLHFQTPMVVLKFSTFTPSKCAKMAFWTNTWISTHWLGEYFHTTPQPICISVRVTHWLWRCLQHGNEELQRCGNRRRGESGGVVRNAAASESKQFERRAEAGRTARDAGGLWARTDGNQAGVWHFAGGFCQLGAQRHCAVQRRVCRNAVDVSRLCRTSAPLATHAFSLVVARRSAKLGQNSACGHVGARIAISICQIGYFSLFHCGWFFFLLIDYIPFLFWYVVTPDKLVGLPESARVEALVKAFDDAFKSPLSGILFLWDLRYFSNLSVLTGGVAVYTQCLSSTTLSDWLTMFRQCPHASPTRCCKRWRCFCAVRRRKIAVCWLLARVRIAKRCANCNCPTHLTQVIFDELFEVSLFCFFLLVTLSF